MSITEIRIKSLGDMVDRVTPAEPDVETGRWRDSGVYRGSADAGWPLLTSLDQLGGVDAPFTKADLEEHILRNFIRYSRPYLTTAPQPQARTITEFYGALTIRPRASILAQSFCKFVQRRYRRITMNHYFPTPAADETTGATPICCCCCPPHAGVEPTAFARHHLKLR
jgi:hypothetical protein